MDIEKRLQAIEERLSFLEKQLSSRSTLPPLPRTPPKEEKESAFSLWFKKNWLIIVGLLLITWAVGWFVNYAFANNWIGEKARVIIGLVLGLLVYLSGIWFLNSKPRGGQTLITLGLTLAIISLFAAHQFYHFLPASYTLAAMLAFVVATALIAILKNLEMLGSLSVLTAMVIPLLTHTDRPNFILLLSYVLAIDLFALALFIIRGWGWTFHIAWVATLGHAFFMDDIKNKGATSFFTAAFYLLFFIPAVLSMNGTLKQKVPFKGTLIGIVTSLFFFYWVEGNVFPQWRLIYYLVAALISGIFGYALARKWDNLKDEPTKSSLATVLTFNVFFLILGINDHLPAIGANIRLLYVLTECLAAILFARYLFKAPALVKGVSFFLILPLVALINYEPILYAPFLSINFAILCLAVITFLTAAWQLSETHPSSHWTQFVWVLAGGFIMALIWNICHNILPSANIARGVALVLYSIAAEVLIYIGHLKQLQPIRLGGIGILIFVIGRLVFKEIWLMPIVVRTITFVVIGLLLIGTAFFDRKIKAS